MENSLKTINSCNYNLGAFPSFIGGGTDSSKTCTILNCRPVE